MIGFEMIISCQRCLSLFKTYVFSFKSLGYNECVYSKKNYFFAFKSRLFKINWGRLLRVYNKIKNECCSLLDSKRHLREN